MTHSPDPQTSERIKQTLLQLTQRAASIAKRGVTLVRNLFMLSLIIALWLTFFFAQQFGLSAAGVVVLLILLVPPVLMLGWLYRALREIVELPERLNAFYSSTKTTASTVRTEAQEKLKTRRFALTDVRALAKIAIDLSQLVRESRELPALVSGMLIVMRPIFIGLAGMAIIYTILLAFIAAITLLIYFL